MSIISENVGWEKQDYPTPTSSETSQDIFYLHQALTLANINRGFCAPNPSVGAVIVNNNEVIATGYHSGPGTSHAETDALAQVTALPSNSTMYITLEPCCHFGRTPPCTDAIIWSGVKRVVYAFQDPNPIVAGKGAQALRLAGITCDYLPTPEIDLFYQSYNHWHQTKLPFITAKIAMTLDAKIAGINSERIQITGEKINQFTHQQRKCHDAILTTIKTIIADDPKLNVRNELHQQIFAKHIYLLDSNLNLPLSAKLFTTAKAITVFHAKNASAIKQAALISKNVRCVAVENTDLGLDLNMILEYIGQDGVHDLWVEAGGKCFTALLDNQLLNRAFIYIAPRYLSEGIPAFSTTRLVDFTSRKIRYEQIGQDLLCDIRW